MPNEDVLNAIAVGLALMIVLGAFLMMFSDFWTGRKR